MRFKLVPEPPNSVEFVADAQRAVPLVPGTEDDCCARLMERTGMESRDVARTWLTFLRALELAEETDSGFARTRREPDAETLSRSLRDHVFGVSAILDVLRGADRPLSADEVFEAFREEVPTWERHKNPNAWEDVWRERVERVLGWGVLLGPVEKEDDGYRSA